MLFQMNYTIYMLPIFDRVRVRVKFHVQIKYSNSMIFKNSLLANFIQSATWLTASWFVGELSCNLIMSMSTWQSRITCSKGVSVICRIRNVICRLETPEVRVMVNPKPYAFRSLYSAFYLAHSALWITHITDILLNAFLLICSRQTERSSSTRIDQSAKWSAVDVT